MADLKEMNKQFERLRWRVFKFEIALGNLKRRFSEDVHEIYDKYEKAYKASRRKV